MLVLEQSMHNINADGFKYKIIVQTSISSHPNEECNGSATSRHCRLENSPANKYKL